MKRFFNIILIVTALFISTTSQAGNDQRSGQSGASELLINPWAASSGWGGAGMASISGFDALYENVAGTAFTRKTELVFSRVNWFQGTKIYLNNFGFSQKIGESGGVLSMAINSMDFGEINVTTTEDPDGNGTTFHPTYTTITAAYAKAFSNSINGGVALKIINEGISDLKSSGVALDFGIGYLAGIGKNKLGKKHRDNLHFGISLKNIGPTMKFNGDGLTFRGSSTNDVIMTVQNRTDQFELPTLLKIGVALDFNLVPKVDTASNKIMSEHKLTVASAYTSNSFTKDIIHAGLEYKYKNLFVLRGGYMLEGTGNSSDVRTINYTGPTGGASFNIPINKTGSYFSIEYSYRATEIFSGVHTFGAKVVL
jgi:hypothetical protein